MKRSLVAGLLFALMTAPALAAPADNSAKAAAEAMLHRFIDSWNRADGPAYGENYWPDAELVDPTGHVVSGGKAIQQEHVDLWAGPFKGSHMQGKIRRIRMLGTKYMIVDLDLELSGVKQLPHGSPAHATVLKNHLKHIMEKRGAVWKVLSAQNTFIAQP
jgi:uncharacterized protein (TIGR02246 family)